MSPEFMLVTFVLFLAGSIAVPIASRLGLGSVLGYLIAGIVISPMFNVMGVDVAALQHFAEFGIIYTMQVGHWTMPLPFSRRVRISDRLKS